MIKGLHDSDIEGKYLKAVAVMMLILWEVHQLKLVNVGNANTWIITVVATR